jgi:hypothetical protein
VTGVSGSGVGVMDQIDSNYGVYGASGSSYAGYFNGDVRVSTLEIVSLASAGTTSLCRNSSNKVSTCSSSIRYKTNVDPFPSGSI